MKIYSIKTRKPRSFNFKARYYDADKEEFEARKKQAIRDYKLEKKTGLKPDELREKLRSEWKGKYDSDSVAKQSTYRVAIIALLLFAFMYIYLYTDLLA
jgi:hypothetical protein